MPEFTIGNLKIHVEVLGLLLFFATSLEESVTTNLIIYKTCHVSLGYNETECALLGTKFVDNATAALEEKVQPHANILLMTRTMLDSIITAVLCFFLGTWSDRYGRKPIFLSVFGGYSLSFIIMLIISLLNVSPWFIILRSIPYCLSGGYPCLFAAMLSYIADVTSEENRGSRMGIFEALLSISMIFGSLVSSYIFNACGYPVIYTISATCVMLAWLFALIMIPESIPHVEQEGKLKNLFQVSLVKKTFETVLKRRSLNGRALILLTLLLIVIFMLSTFGISSLLFLFLREKFTWSLEKFTQFNSFNNLIMVIGSITGPYIFHKLFRLKEIVVILGGVVSALMSAIFLGLASQDWHIYAATSMKCLSGAVNPMAHCLLSKLVPSEETGKIFSLITSFQTICTFVIGAPIYTFIYNSTLTTFPAAFIFVTVGMYVFELMLICAIFRLQRPTSNIRIQ